MTEKKKFNPPNVAKVPTTPGAYILYDEKGRAIYAGAAAGQRGLRHRLQAYQETDQTRTPTEKKKVNKTKSFSIYPTGTKSQAWKKENTLIKKHKPTLNKYKKKTTKSKR